MYKEAQLYLAVHLVAGGFDVTEVGGELHLEAYYIRPHCLSGTTFGQLPHVTVQRFSTAAAAAGALGVRRWGISWGLNLHRVITMSGIDNGARPQTLWVTLTTAA